MPCCRSAVLPCSVKPSPYLFEDTGENMLRAVHRQVADVEMTRADVHQGADRARADLFGRRTSGELLRQPLDRHRQEAVQRLERPRVRAAVKEDAENAGQLKLA